MNIEELRLLSAYEAWNTAETRSRYLALRCFFLTGNISLALAFYRRAFTLVFEEVKIA